MFKPPWIIFQPTLFQLSFTIEGYPHVYNVTLDLVDFDIFQQKREQLSSAQQAKFVEEFGTKKNPFLRIKQLWGQFNAYSDFPLEIRNKAGEIVGSLDPDFYFRSFEMFDNDVVNNITINQGKLNDLTATLFANIFARKFTIIRHLVYRTATKEVTTRSDPPPKSAVDRQ